MTLGAIPYAKLEPRLDDAPLLERILPWGSGATPFDAPVGRDEVRARYLLLFLERATRVAIAVRARTAAGGRVERLEELVPEWFDRIPIDPYDGRPLRFDRESGRVWSVGEDLVEAGARGLGLLDPFEPSLDTVGESSEPIAAGAIAPRAW
jgi:hypothetical protein